MLVEVMFAVALLGIFGSTLFIAQSILLKKTAQSHLLKKIAQVIDDQIIEFTLKIKEAEQANQSILLAPISKKIDNPEIEITVSGSYFELVQIKKEPDTEKSKPSLFKIEAVVKHERGEERAHIFLYKPQQENAT
jgi:hypothetical protein